MAVASASLSPDTVTSNTSDVTVADVTTDNVTMTSLRGAGAAAGMFAGPPRALYYYHVIYLSVALAIGVPGNAVVLAAYAALKNKTSCDWYILHIAVLDLIVCLFRVPTYLAMETGHWRQKGTDALCKFVYWSSQSVITASVIIFGLIAIDRYIKVCRPSIRITARFSRNCIIVITVLSALFALPTFWMYGNNSVGSCVVVPTMLGFSLLKTYYTVLFACFIVMLLIVVVCYTLIVVKVKKSQLIMRRHTSKETSAKKTQAVKKLKKVRRNQVASTQHSGSGGIFTTHGELSGGHGETCFMSVAQSLRQPTIAWTERGVPQSQAPQALLSAPNTNHSLPIGTSEELGQNLQERRTISNQAPPPPGQSGKEDDIVNESSARENALDSPVPDNQDNDGLQESEPASHAVAVTNIDNDTAGDGSKLILSAISLNEDLEKDLCPESGQYTENQKTRECVTQRGNDENLLPRHPNMSADVREGGTFNLAEQNCSGINNGLSESQWRAEHVDRQSQNIVTEPESNSSGRQGQTNTSGKGPVRIRDPSTSSTRVMSHYFSQTQQTGPATDDGQTNFSGTVIHDPTSVKGRSSALRTSRSFRLTLLLLLVTVVFVISWIPPYVAMVWYFYVGYTPPLSSSHVALQLYAPTGYVLNHFANPIIYIALSASFRENVAALWKAVIRKLN